MTRERHEEEGHTKSNSPISDLAPRKLLTTLRDRQKWNVRCCRGKQLPRAAVSFRLFRVEHGSAGKTEDSEAAKRKDRCEAADEDDVGHGDQPDSPEEGVASYPQQAADGIRSIKQS